MKKRLLTALMFALLGASYLLAQGPLTPLMTLNGKTDSNGYLLTSFGTYAAPDTPLTPLGNLRGRTDSNGYLLVTGTGGGTIPDASCFTFTSNDTALCREAANVIGQRSPSAPTSGQTFRVYNSYTSGVNFEDVEIAWSGNNAFIQTGQIGGGSSRSLVLRNTGNSSTVLGSNSTDRLTVSGGGNIQLGSPPVTFMSITAPTATTFCTSPSIPNSNGTAAFTVNVGSACATSVGVITLPSAATGWVVNCFDVTTPASYVIGQTGGTQTTATITAYARTTGLASNWTSADVLRCTAVGY